MLSALSLEVQEVSFREHFTDRWSSEEVLAGWLTSGFNKLQQVSQLHERAFLHCKA